MWPETKATLVGGHLGLLHDPSVRPVAGPAEHRQIIRIHLACQGVKLVRPAPGGPSLGQALHERLVRDRADGIEVEGVRDALGRQSDGERLLAVDPHLQLEGQPPLDLEVAEPSFRY